MSVAGVREGSSEASELNDRIKASKTFVPGAWAERG